MDVLLSLTKWGSFNNGGSQCLFYMDLPFDAPEKRCFTCLNEPASAGRFITLVIRDMPYYRFEELSRYHHIIVTQKKGKNLYQYD